jgi:hypothetical protein
MQSFATPFEREAYIMYAETDLDIDRAVHDFCNESAILSLSIFTEADEEVVKGAEKTSGNKFLDLINRIVQATKRVVTNFITAVRDTFGFRENITAEEYFQSSNAIIRFDEDTRKINAEIHEELLKGRKMIQLVSKGTHIDDHLIAAFVDRCAKIVNKYGGAVIKAGASLVIGKEIQKSIEDNFNIVETTGNELRKKVIKDNKEERYKKKLHEREKKYADSPKKLALSNLAADAERQISQILGTMQKLVSKSANSGTKFFSKMSKFQKK